MKKQWISVKCGLSRDPKHRQEMGISIWLFLHILDRADWESGKVLEWKDEAEADEMGMPVRTLREQRRKLEESDYISCTQKHDGQEITIMNWTNPREYSGSVYNKKQGGRKASPSTDEGYIEGNRKHVTPTSDSNINLNLSIENAIFAGVEVTEEMVQKENLRDLAPKMFERALGFSKPLPWWNGKEWTAFGEWVCDRYAESKTSFGEYNIWRATPYTKGAMANTRIRLSTIEFMDSWDMFMMSKGNTDARPEYQAVEQVDTSNSIPNPHRKPRL